MSEGTGRFKWCACKKGVICWLEISQVKQDHVCLDLEVVSVALSKLMYRIAINLAFLGNFWKYTEKYFLPH